MVTCYIGVGSNLGDRRAYIDKAISQLGLVGGIKVKRVSSIYETEPVGAVKQGKFLNGVLEVETDLGARQLLTEIGHIERALGRIRTVKDGSRTIDLDILYFGNERIDEAGLKVPHPRIAEREFVLKGLRELGKA
jgi:2-amino-4-hydroxy-6-hydroxymethyldihydropteridine diphosphokinase